MLTAVASASLDRLPLIAIATTVSSEPGVTITHQKVPLLAIFDPLVKQADEVTAGNVHSLLPETLELACAPRPGPIFLTLPGGEARKEILSAPDAVHLLQRSTRKVLMLIRRGWKRLPPASGTQSAPP